MTRWIRWTLPAVAVLIVALFAARSLKGRGDTPPAAAAAASSPASAALPTLALAAQDLLQARRTELARQIEVSGTLRAINTAVVKARVAGELKSVAVREGDTVRAGQAVAQIDTTEFDWKLRQAEQQAAAAQAQLDIARRQLTNNKALVNQGFISPTALETSVSNEAGALATLQAAQAAVELARKARNDAALAAPIGGLVSQRLAQPGERVAVDGRILEIVDLSTLELEAAVPPQDVAALRVGARARLEVEGGGAPLTATVVRINPAAASGARTVPAYLSVAGAPGLRSGLFARGWIELERRAVLAVPATAVRNDQARPYVVVAVTRDGSTQAEHRPLTLGLRGLVDGAEWVEVSAGLAEGERVLAASTGLVASGARLRLPATAASAPAPASAASR
ncbi:efflux RND transporter periplasmic adaptor subunit [Ideonella sp. DXS22W]|uniref:Efflux RND transporter periplasmic adaptor subunit n=1 Tax=Pseudaquabacterium inlustre TaxID=2984192 RepID=A0ABU9CMR2_9BURK